MQRAGNIKLRVKIKTKRTMQRKKKTKSWFFQKINNIDKFSSKLTKRLRENIQINKSEKKRGQRNGKESLCKTLKNYSTKLENL